MPGFADASRPALKSLGRVSVEAKQAVDEGAEEVPLLARSGRDAERTTEPVKDLAHDIDDPRRIVEYDTRAERTCDDRTKPCWATGRDGPTGYTGMEGLLNYAYYLAGATNQVDQVSHILHVGIYTVGDFGDPCGAGWWTGHEPDGVLTGVPKEGGGKTTDFLEADPCVSWLGASQPGINEDLGLPPYDPAVCPNGSLAPELCDPAGPEIRAKRGKVRKPGDIKAVAKQLAERAPRAERADESNERDGKPRPLNGLTDLLGPVVADLPLVGQNKGQRRDSTGLDALLGVLFGEPGR
jgi:hypothetical protein